MKNTFLLDENSSFEMVVEALDKGGIGFLAVLDKECMLQGIVTDGDIRRALLKKNFSIKAMLNTKPEVMCSDAPQREIIARLRLLHRRHMPLVDQEGRFKEVFSLDQFEFVSRDNSVVVMAGGLGSRLGELTKDTPKPMLNVGNKPMLLHLVELFSEQGFRNFIFCVNYKKEVIKNYFQDGNDFGVKISYVEENERLGTAGALSLLQGMIDDPFFVVNADVLTSLNFVDLLDFHTQSNSDATMCVKQYSHQVPFGVVNSDAARVIVSISEKPKLDFDVNAGVYLLNPDLINEVPVNEFYDMPSLYEKLIGNGQKASIFRVEDYWIDIGRQEDLHQANSDMKLS